LGETKVEKSNDGLEIPCSLSNDGMSKAKAFNDKDVIRWRLVGINMGPSQPSYVKG
jgi:hypothetical protein